VATPVSASAPAAGRITALVRPSRRGAAIFIVSGLIFVANDSLTKVLVSNVPVIDVVFGRYVTYVLALVLLAGRMNPGRLIRTQRPALQIARGLSMFATTGTFFWSLSLLPFAEVNTIASIAPLIVIVLAGPLLHERITRAIALGGIVGFVGVVVLVGIDPANLQPAILVPLGSAGCYAAFTLLTRLLRAEPPDVTVFYSGIVGLVASGVLFVVIPTSSEPVPIEWLGIGVVGLVALTGHRLLVGAYRWGRASELAPLGYLSILWSFLLGAAVFHEPVEVQAVIGAALIAAGGIMALRAAPDDEEPVSTSVEFGDPVAS
jgi:drug/metabolite transporter (DMT)-like permease